MKRQADEAPAGGDKRARVNVLDEGLYSRQLYVLGKEAMQALSQAHCLISGMSAVGVETAKNVILAGLHSVTVHDERATEWSDLSGQFYLKESSVGKNRATECLPQLAELNPYVRVSARTDALTDEVLSAYSVVVLADARDDAETRRISAACHARGIVFVSVEARGLFGAIFTDFGDAFTVRDVDGETPPSHIITSIMPDAGGEGAVVMVHDESRITFDSGAHVRIDEVRGLEGVLPQGVPLPVEVHPPYSFRLPSVSLGDAVYEAGGTATVVKPRPVLHFDDMATAYDTPGEFVMSDFAKFERPAQLHVAFRALRTFAGSHGGVLPTPGSAADADAVVAIAKELNAAARSAQVAAAVEEVDEDLVRRLAWSSAGVLSPVAAFLGGIAGQEVLKISGKFTPIRQWFYFDALECVPATPLTAAQLAPQGNRYDGQVAVLGQDMQRRLESLRVFLVGSGALGCELLKNFAMMGVACGAEGQLQVTDMDVIEKSNLNRQFLFRSSDIGGMKSACAARAARRMNGHLQVVALEEAVQQSPPFDEAFWRAIDVAVNALDNVAARRYVDQQCVLHGKPLLESGTLGTKANTQVILPHTTESYSASADPPDVAIPMCTLKHFPNRLAHTIEWARDLFQGLFTNAAEECVRFLDEPDYLQSLRSNNSAVTVRTTLEGIQQLLQLHRSGADYGVCVAWARVQFEVHYANVIKQLVHNFPPDHRATNGALFWSGPKRCPSPVVFDAGDAVHRDFVVAGARLLASVLGVSPDPSIETLPQLAAATASAKVPPFVPRKVHITTDPKARAEEEAAHSGDADDVAVQELVASLETVSREGTWRPVPHVFEKDDDSNYHMHFITAASNLRARNYGIPEADLLATKRIAGRIVPAIATTTAMVTGLVCMELYKVAAGVSDLERFKNAFVNLALPLWAFSEPLAPARHTSTDQVAAVPDGWTEWDRIEVREADCPTIGALIQYMADTHGVEVSSIAAGQSLMYMSFMPTHAPRLQERVRDRWSTGNADVALPSRLVLVAEADTVEGGLEVDLAEIHYLLEA